MPAGIDLIGVKCEQAILAKGVNLPGKETTVEHPKPTDLFLKARITGYTDISLNLDVIHPERPWAMRGRELRETSV